jgi:hypothetical protein
MILQAQGAPQQTLVLQVLAQVANKQVAVQAGLAPVLLLPQALQCRQQGVLVHQLV